MSQHSDDKQTVNYIRCVYCNEEWVREEAGICEGCEDRLELDVSIIHLARLASQIDKYTYAHLNGEPARLIRVQIDKILNKLTSLNL